MVTVTSAVAVSAGLLESVTVQRNTAVLDAPARRLVAVKVVVAEDELTAVMLPPLTFVQA